MSTNAYSNTSLWPRQARPQRAMPKAIVTGLCVGIIAGISTAAVLTELQPPAPTQVVMQVRSGPETVADAALTSSQAIMPTRAASPAPSLAARDVPRIAAALAVAGAENDERLASTDGRGGDARMDQGATAAITNASVPPAVMPATRMPATRASATPAPSADIPAASPPSVETAEAAKPAAEPAVKTGEPAAKPAGHPPRVAQKKQKKPSTRQSAQQNPFFPFFGRGNGLFFGQRG